MLHYLHANIFKAPVCCRQAFDPHGVYIIFWLPPRKLYGGPISQVWIEPLGLLGWWRKAVLMCEDLLTRYRPLIFSASSSSLLRSWSSTRWRLFAWSSRLREAWLALRLQNSSEQEGQCSTAWCVMALNPRLCRAVSKLLAIESKSNPRLLIYKCTQYILYLNTAYLAGLF